MNDEPSKIFDVSKPSRVNPDNTSRPLIAGHRPSMPDPMMRRENLPTPPPVPTPPVTVPASTSGVVLQPGHVIAQPSPDTGYNAPLPEHHQTKVISVSEKVRSEIAAAEPQPSPNPQPAALQPAVPAPTPQTPETNIVSASPPRVDTPGTNFVSSATSPGGNVVTPSPVPLLPSSLPAPEVVAPEIHHQSLPMGPPPVTSAGRVKHFVLWLFVILFLAAFAGYLAIDAGFVKTSVSLPFHIFNRQAG